jgi:uncharacterized membrane protein YfcA
LILNVITIAVFFANGLLNKAVFENTLYFTPALLAGVFVGIKVSKRLQEDAFKKFVLILLLASGVWTSISTFLELMK